MDDRSSAEIEAENRLAEEEQNEIIHQRVTDFKHSFESAHGKRVYKKLAVVCLENSSTYEEGSPHRTSFNEGARSIILEIRHWLDYDLTKLNQE